MGEAKTYGEELIALFSKAHTARRDQLFQMGSDCGSDYKGGNPVLLSACFFAGTIPILQHSRRHIGEKGRQRATTENRVFSPSYLNDATFLAPLLSKVFWGG